MIHARITAEVDDSGVFKAEFMRLNDLERNNWNDITIRRYVYEKESILRQQREDMIQGLVDIEVEKLERVGA